ncbi:MAG: hypothetical protein QOF48_4041 [Verrucomicrobiota bacterium]|jgi:hypothetical protein
MKTISIVLLGVIFLNAGCAGGSRRKQREQEAFLRGQQQAIAAQQQAQEPAVWFHGMVRHPRVPWTENLTLAQALVMAQYTGALDPTSIKVIRQGQTYRIDPKRLIRGLEDPPLEPGDLIEVSR